MGEKLRLEGGVAPPKHVAVICDGNRRWAKAKGKPTWAGHRAGVKRVEELVSFSRQLGIHTLTLWAFSTENWQRSKEEVSYLMQLYAEMIDSHLRQAHKHEARVIHLGRKDRLPQRLLKKIINAEAETAAYERHVLNIALDYGGQDEMLRGMGRWIKAGRRRPFADYLDTGGQPYPYPDLIIRTGGELRLSGFMLWQAAYSEFYFAKEPLPDFTRDKFYQAVTDFVNRSRRYGGD